MDEQRLERALRAGPPFATAYVARPLVLREPPAAVRWPVRRVALLLALTALLLAATIVGALVAGLFRPAPLAVMIREISGCTAVERLCPDTLNVRYIDGHEETVFPPAGIDAVDIAPGTRWSPNGRQLIVMAASLATGGPVDYRLYLVDADGSDVRLLRDAELGWCGYLRWSPDGRTLGCTADEYDEGGSVVASRLLAIDVASGALTELDRFSGAFWSPQYRWSPNSEWLVYQVGGLGSPASAVGDTLWVVRRDGSDRKQLVAASEMPFSTSDWDTPDMFVWSPASDAIAFGDLATYPHSKPWGPYIHVVRLDGGQSEIPLPQLPDRGSGVTIGQTGPEVLAWSRPDEITYGAGGSDWLYVATTKLDGTGGDVLIDWVAQPDMPYDRDIGVPWQDLWLSADGRTLHWWHYAGSWCLMAAERGDGRPRREWCFDAEAGNPKAVGEG